MICLALDVAASTQVMFTSEEVDIDIPIHSAHLNRKQNAEKLSTRLLSFVPGALPCTHKFSLKPPTPKAQRQESQWIISPNAM